MVSYACSVATDSRFWIHDTVMMVVRLPILASIELWGLLPCLLCLLHLEVCETLLHLRMHVVIKSKETAVMKARETTLCMNGSAKQSVPGGGRGSSNKSNPATAENGKALVGITSTGDRSITLVILFKCTNLHSFAAGGTL
jgi:hypothetical protein